MSEITTKTLTRSYCVVDPALVQPGTHYLMRIKLTKNQELHVQFLSLDGKATWINIAHGDCGITAIPVISC